MSGHSKWSKIQHKKGKVDSARSNLFTKLSKAITMAASQGGGDPEMNFGLRLAIEKAKADNVPKDNIERAIKRGSGELTDETALEEIIYEAFGPFGTAFLIEVVTDNKNRAVSEIKHMLSKHDGSLGGPGSVQWQFNHLGVIRMKNEEFRMQNEKFSDFELELMDAGVDDIKEGGFGVELYCKIEKLQSVLEVVKKFEIKAEDSGLEWVPKEELKLSDEDEKKAEKLYEALDELDDVKSVYVNI